MLACGGFEWNHDMVLGYLGYDVRPLSPGGNTGDGHVMAMEAGARMGLMGAYWGQGAMLLAAPEKISNPFFLLAPAWAQAPLVVLATAATIIASQANGTWNILRAPLGFLLFLFTNQSGIGRGLHTLEDTHRVNARMEEMIGLGSPLFTAIGIAPEAPGQPVVYRKPSPRFILESIARHGLDPAQCWMVGDSAADIGAGLGAGIRAAAVRTGKVDPAGVPEVKSGLVPVFANFAAFAETLT